MHDDDPEIRPRDHGEEVALFRFGVIGALTQRQLARGQLRAAMRTLSDQSFRPPGAARQSRSMASCVTSSASAPSPSRRAA
jgi:hypothetical protein